MLYGFCTAALTDGVVRGRRGSMCLLNATLLAYAKRSERSWTVGRRCFHESDKLREMTSLADKMDVTRQTRIDLTDREMEAF